MDATSLRIEIAARSARLRDPTIPVFVYAGGYMYLLRSVEERLNEEGKGVFILHCEER